MANAFSVRYPQHVSASCLSSLFADRFMRRISLSGRALAEAAVVTPTTGTLVKVANVERQCLATALWSLEHQGLIEIHLKRSDASNFLGRIGEDRLLFERIEEGEHLIGVEGTLLDAFPERPIEARQLYVAAFGAETPDALLTPLQKEAVAANVVSISDQKEDRILPSLRWSSLSRCVIREGTRETLETQFRAADDLGLFGNDQSRLFSKVRRQCGLAAWKMRSPASDA
jgi:hypothetical protein